MVSEVVHQQHVCEMLDLLGWSWRHPRTIRVLADGTWAPDTESRDLPDLIVWHPRGGFAGIELKTDSGRLTSGQRSLLAQWARSVPVAVVRPRDVPELARWLRSVQAQAAHPARPPVPPFQNRETA